MAHQVLQIKVTLLGSKPPIWRRVLVPSILTLAQLHDVIQDTMGWEDYHLHEFEIGGHRYGIPNPDMTFLDGPPLMNDKKVRLYDVLGKAGAKALYTYDFGDGWEHRIVVEKVLQSEPRTAYPARTAGKGHCPPEDCGGMWGYYDFLEAIRDPAHERHEELLEWTGGSFDPDAFSVEQANKRLAGLQRRYAKNLSSA
jgi:hypothetical protein